MGDAKFIKINGKDTTNHVGLRIPFRILSQIHIRIQTFFFTNPDPHIGKSSEFSTTKNISMKFITELTLWIECLEFLHSYPGKTFLVRKPVILAGSKTLNPSICSFQASFFLLLEIC